MHSWLLLQSFEISKPLRVQSSLLASSVCGGKAVRTNHALPGSKRLLLYLWASLSAP
jgi:hypothetical protein